MRDYDDNFRCARRMLNKVITNCGLIVAPFWEEKKPTTIKQAQHVLTFHKNI